MLGGGLIFSSGLSARMQDHKWRMEGCDQPSVHLLDRSFHDVSYSDQVVSGGGEGEHPTHALAAAMFGLAQPGRGLDPAEDLLDEFPLLLA